MYDSEDDVGILKKALDVHLPDNFDPTKVPQSGEEYIQLVMYEAKQCKKWVTADIDTSKFKGYSTLKIELPNLAPAPKKLLPSKDWQKERLDDFTNLRNFIESKLSEDSKVNVIHESHYKERVEKVVPTFSEIVRLSQEAKFKILEIILENLEEIKDGDTFSYETAVWVYSILATLEIPLSPNMCYCLREISRKCASIRSKLPEDSPESVYQPLNLFICVVGNYYGQKDLSD